MNPTIGRTVKYKASEADLKHMRELNEKGVCNIQEELPAVIVAVWGEECVNLKVQLDGNVPDLWVTSAHQGTEKGNWDWFQKQ